MSAIYEAYIYDPAFKKAERLAERLAKERKESLGLLIGKRYSWKEKEYLLITDFISSKTNSTAVSVSFSRESFKTLAAKIRKAKGTVVGWLHSHPNYSCFLSSTDIQTQQNYFNESFHIAAVIDPIRKEKKIFRLNGNCYYEISFAIIRRKENGKP